MVLTGVPEAVDSVRIVGLSGQSLPDFHLGYRKPSAIRRCSLIAQRASQHKRCVRACHDWQTGALIARVSPGQTKKKNALCLSPLQSVALETLAAYFRQPGTCPGRILDVRRIYTGQSSGAELWSGWSWQSRAVNSLFVRVGLHPTAGHTPKLTKTSKDAGQCSHKALEIRYLIVQDRVSEQ